VVTNILGEHSTFIFRVEYFCPENGGGLFLQNIGTQLPDDMVSLPTIKMGAAYSSKMLILTCQNTGLSKLTGPLYESPQP
jgi:hypothetical protein